MIKVDYSERFLKDLKKLKKHDVYSRIKEVCFDELENYNDLDSVRSLKKIKGFSNYYRIRVGDHRIGLKIENNILIIMRVLHRKDIYKYFP